MIIFLNVIKTVDRHQASLNVESTITAIQDKSVNQISKYKFLQEESDSDSESDFLEWKNRELQKNNQFYNQQYEKTNDQIYAKVFQPLNYPICHQNYPTQLQYQSARFSNYNEINCTKANSDLKDNFHKIHQKGRPS